MLVAWERDLTTNGQAIVNVSLTLDELLELGGTHKSHVIFLLLHQLLPGHLIEQVHPGGPGILITGVTLLAGMVAVVRGALI